MQIFFGDTISRNRSTAHSQFLTGHCVIDHFGSTERTPNNLIKFTFQGSELRPRIASKGRPRPGIHPEGDPQFSFMYTQV